MRVFILLIASIVGFTAFAQNGKATRRRTQTVSHESPSSNDGDSSHRDLVAWNDLEQPGRSVVGYLGRYFTAMYPQPIIIGADYRMPVPGVPDWAMRAGFSYWTASGWATGGGTASLLDLSVAAGHVWTIKRVEIEGGGRLGYDTFKVDKTFYGWNVFEKSGNSLVLAPYAAGSFKFSAAWSAGVEVRFPYFFKGGGILLDQPYVLAQGQYHF